MSSGKPEQVESHGASPGPPAPGHEPDVFEWAEKAGIENMIGKHKTAEWLAQQASVTFTVLEQGCIGVARCMDCVAPRDPERPYRRITAALSATRCGQCSLPNGIHCAAIRRHQGRRERNSAKRPRQCHLSQLEDDRPAIGKRCGGLFVCAHGPRARPTSSQRVAARHPPRGEPGPAGIVRRVSQNCGECRASLQGHFKCTMSPTAELH